MELTDLKPGKLPNDFIVIKFSTPTCGPCKMLAPLFDNLKIEGVNFFTINPIEEEKWVEVYKIKATPTTIGFLNNKEVFRVLGNSIDSIKENIYSILNPRTDE